MTISRKQNMDDKSVWNVSFHILQYQQIYNWL